MSTEELSFKQIDGVDYNCEMMGALKANATVVRLMHLVGRTLLVMAADAFESSENTGQINLGDLVKVGTHQIFMRLTPEESEEVLLLVMDGVRYKGCPLQKDLSDPDIFNKHFRGRLLSAYKVWAWSLRCNFRDFLEDARLAGLIEQAKAKALELSTQTLTRSQEPSSTEKTE